MLINFRINTVKHNKLSLCLYTFKTKIKERKINLCIDL